MNTSDAYRDAEYIADVSGTSYGSDVGQSAQQSGQGERLKKVQSAAKVLFIDRLLRDLDILIYCELSALYYMDCSIIVFAVRAMVQLIFFTPKAPPFDPTRNQPFIGAIFASNLFCMAYHKFLSHPEADETTRGYLHGGLLIDFIGQKAPVSLVRLLSLDVLVLLLDLIMLGLIIERVKTIDATGSNSTASEPIETSPDPQDHDSEERGLLRTGPRPSPPSSASPQRPPNAEDIELDELHPRNESPHSDASADEQLERTELLAEPAGGKHTHPLDVFSSGEAVVMNMGLWNVIRDQWRYSPVAARRPSPYVPSDQTANFLRERFGLQVGPDGRVQRIGS